jgi:hypothetical protein
MILLTLIERTADGQYRPGPTLRAVERVGAEPTLHSYGPLAVYDLSAVLGMTIRLGFIEDLQLSYCTSRSNLARDPEAYSRPGNRIF